MLEKEEEASGIAIASKKKSAKSKTGRQAKMTATGSLTTSKPSLVTKPSAFAEIVAPIIPEFCAEKPKKKPGRATKKEKEDPTQTKLEFTSEDKKEGNDTGEEALEDDSVAKKTVKVTKKQAAPKVTRKRAPKRQAEETIDNDPFEIEDSDDDFTGENRKEVIDTGDEAMKDDSVAKKTVKVTKRQAAPKRSSKKEESKEMEGDSDDGVAKKTAKVTRKRAPKRQNEETVANDPFEIEDSDDDNDMRAPLKKKPVAKKAKVDTESSEIDFKEKKKPPAKKASQAKLILSKEIKPTASKGTAKTSKETKRTAPASKKKTYLEERFNISDEHDSDNNIEMFSDYGSSDDNMTKKKPKGTATTSKGTKRGPVVDSSSEDEMQDVVSVILKCIFVVWKLYVL